MSGEVDDGAARGRGALVDAIAAAVDVATSDAYGTICLDVSPPDWSSALLAAARVGARLDWLGGVDVGSPSGVEREADAEESPSPAVEVVTLLLTDESAVLLRTRVAPGSALDSATSLFPGAAWHERETAEMLGVDFGGGSEDRLLLPPTTSGYPLRRDFPLSARTSKPWPGAADVTNRRRRGKVPGVNPEWLDAGAAEASS